MIKAEQTYVCDILADCFMSAYVENGISFFIYCVTNQVKGFTPFLFALFSPSELL